MFVLSVSAFLAISPSHYWSKEWCRASQFLIVQAQCLWMHCVFCQFCVLLFYRIEKRFILLVLFERTEPCHVFQNPGERGILCCRGKHMIIFPVVGRLLFTHYRARQHYTVKVKNCISINNHKRLVVLLHFKHFLDLCWCCRSNDDKEFHVSTRLSRGTVRVMSDDPFHSTAVTA